MAAAMVASVAVGAAAGSLALPTTLRWCPRIAPTQGLFPVTAGRGHSRRDNLATPR